MQASRFALALSLAVSLSLAVGPTVAAAATPSGDSGKAQSGDATELTAAKHAIQDAMDHGDGPAGMKARSRVVALSAAEPKSAALHYWVAFADWRVVPFLIAMDKKQAESICADGVSQCEQALALDPKYGEALALKSSLEGESITFHPESGRSLGPVMIGEMARAVALAPANPRVLLLDGVNTFHMPSFVGGGAAPALAKLKHAEAAFAASPDSLTEWGYDDACVWAGRSAMELKDFAGARAYFEKALEINAANGWVRTGLMPAVEDSLAARSKS
jgi:hypothetical protein